MNPTLVMLLAGGVGSRLNILAASRAKPAVPFGGVYRIIDFTLSNAMNSGLSTVGVLTQYKPLSLMQHIGAGEPWDFIGRTRGAKILPPRTGQQDSDWYRGTADAVRQNIDFIESRSPERVLILSGDHIYKMDYETLIAYHQAKQADLTVGVMTVDQDETHNFGIAVVDENNLIIDWEEKPSRARSTLASMGIYVFETSYLLKALRAEKQHDFGEHIIPAALRNDHVFAYPFDGYWRDVGTLNAFWDANMDLLDSESGLDIRAWGLRTNVEEQGLLADRTPAFIDSGASVKNAVVSPGCIVRGFVEHSILSPGVVVQQGASVIDSVIMHDCECGVNSRVEHAILDKGVKVGADCAIGVGVADVANRETPHHLTNGMVVVGKRAVLPDGIRIEKNSILHPHLLPSDFVRATIPRGSTIRPGPNL